MYPILFSIGDITIRSYDAFAALGVIAGFAVLFFTLRKASKNTRKSTLLFAALIFIPFLAGAFIGSAFEYFISGAGGHLLGEASLWWGLAAAAGSSFFLAPRFKLDVWETGDMLAPSVALGFFFVRLGCFLNGCCHGMSCSGDFKLALRLPESSLLSSGLTSGPVYPTQLFDAFAWLLILVLLPIISIKRFKGIKILSLIIAYSVLRFFIDFLRYYPDITHIIITRTWPILAIITGFFALVLRQKQK